MRSKLSRRAKVTASAGGLGARPSFSNPASTKASIGFFTQLAFFTGGTLTGFNGSKDQCCWYSAPSATHRLKRSF